MKYVLVDAINFAEVENAAFAFARQSGMLLPTDNFWAVFDELRQLQAGREYALPPGMEYPGAYDTPAPWFEPVWCGYVWRNPDNSIDAHLQAPGQELPATVAEALAAGREVERIERESPAELLIEGARRYGWDNPAIQVQEAVMRAVGYLPRALPVTYWSCGRPGAWTRPEPVERGKGVLHPWREITGYPDATPVIDWLREFANPPLTPAE